MEFIDSDKGFRFFDDGIEVACRLFENGPNGPVALMAAEPNSELLNEIPLLLRRERCFEVDIEGLLELAPGQFDIDIRANEEIDLQSTHIFAVVFYEGKLRDQLALGWCEKHEWFEIDCNHYLENNDGSLWSFQPTLSPCDEEQAFRFLRDARVFTSSAWPALFNAYGVLKPLATRAIEHRILYDDGWHPAHAEYKASVAINNALGSLSPGQRLIFTAMLKSRSTLEIPLSNLASVPAFNNLNPPPATIADRLVSIRSRVRRHGFYFAIHYKKRDESGYFRWEKRADQTLKQDRKK